MGDRGCLSLVNGCTAIWKRTAKSSTKLKKWDFPEVVGGGQTVVEIETDGESHVPSDASGDVTYQLQDTSSSFEIQLRVVDGQIVLQVVWAQTPENFVVFPPASAAGGGVDIGWSKDGTVSLGVFNLKVKPLPPVPVNDPAPWTADWFGFYGTCMATLPLSALTIPGTHDSGSYGIPFPNLYTKTQDLSFTDQLSAGVRYFDMRVGYEGDQQFILVHDWVKSTVTLADALGQIRAYIDAHAAEIIILDFHRFTNFTTDPISYDGPDFPYAKLADCVETGLGSTLFSIPAGMDAAAVTLNDVYDPENGGGRVLVSFNPGGDPPYYTNPAYIPPITQVWQGSELEWNRPDGLKKFITCVLDGETKDCPDKKPVPIPTGIWAMMAAINYPPIVHPQSLAPDIDNWFPGGSAWSTKCNAIPTDFIEQTALVGNCVCTSIYKGTQG
jgi:1-phosphatidylinositol phosphodiesterase